LRDEFGKPVLVLTTVDEGKLLETYVYQQMRPGKVMFAYLKDGKVFRVASAN
jgi:hypothetical protein